jgi:phage minor structural protein
MAQIHITDAQTDDVLGVISDRFWDDLRVQNLEEGSETFDFKTMPELSETQFLRKRNRVIIPDEDGLYREYIIDEHGQELDAVEVFTTASYLELARCKPIPAGTYPGHTPKTALELLLADTDWQPGRAEYASTTDLVFEDYVSPFAALKTAAALLNRELSFRVETNGYRVTGRYVDMVERIGQWRGREIISGVDLINARRRETTDNVVTALIGLGPSVDGSSQIVVEVTDADARQRWGRSNQHLWSVFKPEFNKEPEFVTPTDVEDATRGELTRRINAVVQYEVTAADLENIFGRDHEKIRLGDSIRIKATEYDPPLYMDARVIAIESSIRDASEKKFTLGEFIEYSADEIEQLRNEFRDMFAETRGIHYGPTPPDDLAKLWIDTTYEPYRVMVYSYDEALWKRATPINAIEVGAEIETHRDITPPTDTRKLWIDTSVEPNVMKQYDSAVQQWIKVTPTEASEVGAETPQGAQDKADQAEQDANDYTDTSSQAIRTDLRLTAPLPTEVTMDATGITASATSGGFAKLDYRGLYVSGGAIMIDGGLGETNIADAVITRIQSGESAKSTLDSKASVWDAKANGTYIDSQGVYTGEIVANQIVGGTISGITFQTYGSGSDSITISGGELSSYGSANTLHLSSGGIRLIEDLVTGPEKSLSGLGLVAYEGTQMVSGYYFNNTNMHIENNMNGYIYIDGGAYGTRFYGDVDFSNASVSGVGYATNAGSASLLDGYDSSDFALAGHTHGNLYTQSYNGQALSFSVTSGGYLQIYISGSYRGAIQIPNFS